MFKKIFSVVLISGLANSASAFWDVQKSDKDVFGNVNVTVSSFGDNSNLLRFECGSSSEPFFVFLIRDNSGTIPDVPAVFLHVDQDGERHESEAVLQSWNEKYVAVKVTNTDAIRTLADHMIVAKKSIPVGIQVPNFDIQVADTFSPSGSTKAGNAIIDDCL